MTALKRDVFSSNDTMNILQNDMSIVAPRPEKSDRLLALCPGQVRRFESAAILPFHIASADKPKEITTATSAEQPTQSLSSQPPDIMGNTTGGEPPPQSRQKRLIDLKEVLRQIPVTRQTLTNWEKAGTFPRRIILPDGVTVCWLESEVLSWIEQSARRRFADNQD